jgi:hypothetical protein
MIVVTPQFDWGPHHPRLMPLFAGVLLRAYQDSYAHHLGARRIATGYGLAWVFGFVRPFTNPFLAFISYLLPR